MIDPGGTTPRHCVPGTQTAESSTHTGVLFGPPDMHWHEWVVFRQPSKGAGVQGAGIVTSGWSGLSR